MCPSRFPGPSLHSCQNLELVSPPRSISPNYDLNHCFAYCGLKPVAELWKSITTSTIKKNETEIEYNTIE